MESEEHFLRGSFKEGPFSLDEVILTCTVLDKRVNSRQAAGWSEEVVFTAT